MEIWWVGRILILLLLFPRIFGWGKEGHYAVCKIAQGYLSEDAEARVKKLLPDHAEGELATVCSWPDEVRFHYRWSSPLHYVDTPDFRCNYRHCRDCHDSAGHKDRCVTGAIYNYTMQLTSGLNVPDSENKYNLTEALLFLSHFIGDVHQPLHVGFIGDEGGNTVTVRWYRRKTNLHHVWDTMIIESALKTYYDSDLMTMIQAIQRNITDIWFPDISSWENCNSTVCPDPYASESIDLACKYAYRNASPGSILGGFTGDEIRIPIMLILVFRFCLSCCCYLSEYLEKYNLSSYLSKLQSVIRQSFGTLASVNLTSLVKMLVIYMLIYVFVLVTGITICLFNVLDCIITCSGVS